MNNQGIIVTSPESEMIVAEFFKSHIQERSVIHVRSPGQEVQPPVSCIINSDILKQINLHTLFPKERPILLVDSSPKWIVTWELMVFFPTFHIASNFHKQIYIS